MNSYDFSNITAMIIDDEREMRFIIKSALKDMGIKETVESEDTKNAYHIIKFAFKRVDMILCDWNLPGQSGIDFLKQLKEEDKSIPFFIISGRSDSESIHLAKNSGVAGYIRKPFSPAQLEEKIRITLQRMKHV